MTLADRLKSRMAEIGMSQAELARRVGVAQPTIAKLVAGSSRSSTHMHRIARALETTAAYLTGETDDPAEGAMVLPTLEKVAEHFGQILIPLVSLGEVVADKEAGEPRPLRFEAFRTDRLNRITCGYFSDVFAFDVDGDSMAPTIRPGSLCLVDRSQDEIHAQDGLYVVEFGGLPTLKRVRRTGTRTFSLMSDNPVVSAIDVNDKDFTVIGRIVWRGEAL